MTKAKRPVRLNNLAYITDKHLRTPEHAEQIYAKKATTCSHLNDQMNSFHQKLQLFHHQLRDASTTSQH